MAGNDDSCDSGSSMTFTMNSGDTVTIYEGCFDSADCSGTVNIISTSLQVPIIFIPACPYFSASDTNSATQNYYTCSFTLPSSIDSATITGTIANVTILFLLSN